MIIIIRKEVMKVLLYRASLTFLFDVLIVRAMTLIGLVWLKKAFSQALNVLLFRFTHLDVSISMK